jgi:hypothetical protein
MRKLTALRVVAFAVAAVAFAGVRAEAALITLNPSSQSASVNDLVNVDIMVSGLTAAEAVAGVSLNLSFDEAILSGVSYGNDPDAKMGFDQCETEAAGDPFEPGCELSFGFDNLAGNLDLFFLANDELDAAALKALQGASFRLATVTFMAIGPGLSQLVLSTAGAFLSDSPGFNPIAAQALNGEVCVGVDCGDPNPTPVPEPSTWALFGAGAVALLARRFRRTV